MYKFDAFSFTLTWRCCMGFRLDQYTEEQKIKLKDCCPQEVFEYDETASTVYVKDASACIFCKECIYTLEEFKRRPEDMLGVTVNHSTDKFYFTVETNGSLTAMEVVKSAMHQLTEKITRLQKVIPSIHEAELSRS